MGVREDVIDVARVWVPAIRDDRGLDSGQTLGHRVPFAALSADFLALRGDLRKEVLNPWLPQINVGETSKNTHIAPKGNSEAPQVRLAPTPIRFCT